MSLSNPGKLIKKNSMKSSENKADDKKDGKKVGTIYLGPSQSLESNLEKILGEGHSNALIKSAEEEYMDRVKEKALVKVKSLLLRAEERAQAIIDEAITKAQDINIEANSFNENVKALQKEAENSLREAENMKLTAYEEAYNSGLHQAQESLIQAKDELTRATSYTLLSIHEQCITIFNSWRKDLSELLLEAVEKSTGYMLTNDKAAVLQAVLERSVNALLDKREYQINVHPNDAQILTEILEHMHKRYIDSRRWTLVKDASLEEGSIVLESPSGLIRNTVENRSSVVTEILSQLTLPLSDADQTAYDAITETLVTQAKMSNIPLNEEDEVSHAEDVAQANPSSKAVENISQVEENQPQAEAVETVNNAQVSEEPKEPTEKDITQAAINQEALQMVEDLLTFNEESDESEKTPNSEIASEISEELSEELQAQIAKASQEIDFEEAENLEPSEISEEEKINEQVVEEELQTQIEEPQAEKVAEPKKKVRSTAKNKADKDYTPELADELLSEMGF